MLLPGYPIGILAVAEALTDGSEEHTRQLARRLLSVWHWSLAVEPPTYPPPVPTSMNIGYWLRQTKKNDIR